MITRERDKIVNAVLRSPIARNKRGWSGRNIAKLWLSLSDVCFFESRICTSCGAARAQSATSILDDARRPDRKKSSILSR